MLTAQQAFICILIASCAWGTWCGRFFRERGKPLWVAILFALAGGVALNRIYTILYT